MNASIPTACCGTRRVSIASSASTRLHGRLVCEAGVVLRDIQRLFLPRGWGLPVLPGTQFVTVGGAIANDVHGKNHHETGTFGDHVLSLRLLRTDGQEIVCGPGRATGVVRRDRGRPRPDRPHRRGRAAAPPGAGSLARRRDDRLLRPRRILPPVRGIASCLGARRLLDRLHLRRRRARPVHARQAGGRRARHLARAAARHAAGAADFAGQPADAEAAQPALLDDEQARSSAAASPTTSRSCFRSMASATGTGSTARQAFISINASCRARRDPRPSATCWRRSRGRATARCWRC